MIARMLKTYLVLAPSLLLAAATAGADGLANDAGKYKVSPVFPQEARAFPLSQVRLLDSPFKHAMDMNGRYILSLDPDRLLHTFRLNAGLPSIAAPLGGWEEPSGELRGHFAGHYLSACALMFASTGNEAYRAKGRAVVAGMAACQEKIGTGYLSAYPEDFITRVEKGQRVWAPYYTLHKILAGLLDMWVYCDDAQALECAKKFGRWVIARNAALAPEAMQRMLDNEHGGMNEALANLYALTGDDAFLSVSLRFNHHAVIGPAAAGVDKLTGLHANTQVPKFIGTARQHEVAGDFAHYAAAEFFWKTVVYERSYVIGGHSDGEMFSPKETLSRAFGPSTTETCNTYNMLKLTRHLFCQNARAAYADYYERALYNHILASQNPEDGMTCYYLPLRSGSRKTYSQPLNSFWCCTGTGVENHSKYGDSIYFHGENRLFVNLFIASELDWPDKHLKVRQETRFPDEPRTTLTFHAQNPVELTVCLRRPAWAEQGFKTLINGQPADAGSPGSYLAINRSWKDGDRIEIEMPFALRSEGFKDNPDRFAFLNGPIVLCAEVKPNLPTPAVVAPTVAEAVRALQPLDGQPGSFRAAPAVFRQPGGGISAEPLVLSPLYKMHGGRSYQVYWDRFEAQAWQQKEAAYAAELAREKALEARTIDRVNPGQEQNERDHRVQGERTSTGPFGDRMYRHATEGGWFSWDLKVLRGQPQELVLTYWGDDNSRTFQISVDNEVIATEKLTGKYPGKFFDVSYPLSTAQTGGKDKVTVKVQGVGDSWAGGVFGVRVLKKE